MAYIAVRPAACIDLQTPSFINCSENRLFARVLGSTAALGLLAQQAMAEVPAAGKTAIEDAGTDAATIGALVLVVIIGIAAFKYMRRAL